MTPSVLRLVSDVLVPGNGATIQGGAIDIGIDGRIAAVGPPEDLGPAPDRVDHVGGLLMPGLVNGHAHGPMTLVRSVGDGLPLLRWLTEAMWPREGRMTHDDVVIAMQLAFCEMLLAGVTTSTEMYLHEAAVAEAALAMGTRCQIMAGILSIVVPDDAAMQRRLDAISTFKQTVEAQTANITVGYGAHSVYDLGPQRLARLAEYLEGSGRDGPIVHIHLEETNAEREQVSATYERSATEVLVDVGLLGSVPVVAAHGVWLSATDMKLLGDAGASVVHCPQSNLKLGSGIARVRNMLDAGIRVGIGTDGAASNDDLNLWEELRLTPMLARASALDPTAMSAAEAFGLATSAGAEAIGLPDVGVLTAGRWADIVRLDLGHPSFLPGLDEDLLAHIVWAGNAHHVTDVWVGGRQLVQNRALSVDGLDYERLSAQVTAAARRIAEP